MLGFITGAGGFQQAPRIVAMQCSPVNTLSFPTLFRGLKAALDPGLKMPHRDSKGSHPGPYVHKPYEAV